MLARLARPHRAATRLSTAAPRRTVTLFAQEIAPSDAPAPSPDAETVVFVHGLLGSGVNFRSVALAPAVVGGATGGSRRRVLTLDLRNHGRSPHAQGPTTLDTLADDVRRALAVHAPRGALTLVGHSLGGKVASLVALRPHAPHNLARLIVMDIAPVPYSTRDAQWRAVADVVNAAAATDPGALAGRADVDRALRAAVPDAGMRSFVLQNLLLDPTGGYRWRVNLPALQASLPAFAAFPGDTGASAVEAHFVRGETSRYVLPEHHAAIARLFPRGRLHTVAGAGHWIHADRPAEFVALLGQLLRGEGGGAPLSAAGA